MKYRHIIIKLIITTIISMLLCGVLLLNPSLKDFSINLPNGYHLDHNSNTCNVITDHESWVLINKNVDSYLTIKDFVIGHVSREKSTDNDAKELTGYFILDTKSGEIKKGMTKDILISSLNKRGIHTDLKLKQPDIFLALLSKI